MQAEYYTSINVSGTQKELKQIIDPSFRKIH